MSQLSKIVSPISPFLLTYVLIAILSLIPQLIYSQEELFLIINKANSSFSDLFFYWITYFGDGITFVLLIIGLLFYSYRYALLGLVSFLGTAFIAQFLKRFIFSDQLRPIARLVDVGDIYIPENVATISFNSFPSGHTATAFAIASFLTLAFPKKPLWAVWLLLACLTGYSRIYLTHHFPVDVWVGSIIGVLGTIAVFYFLDYRLDTKLGQKSLLNR